MLPRRRPHRYRDARHPLPFSERHQERVTTWTGEQDFDFRRWENVSSDSVKPFDSEGFFTVTMSIDYVLGDKNTRTAFAQQKEGFVAMNRSQDRKYELDEVVDVEGVAKEIVVNTKSNGFSR
ncbi:uncharacterized protein LOC129596532 [Paramacrobiotus metropolitanus]|uniref:uncharacterized protein LOC129596532 n=1 Tax=Paramacrobiotus metropolitanus TaxID=2943436 RepID=UPI0024457AED|nr:uncharacterized protein LOC129596532 [Paramacrobiotus metropolitanus]